MANGRLRQAVNGHQGEVEPFVGVPGVQVLIKILSGGADAYQVW